MRLFGKKNEIRELELSEKHVGLRIVLVVLLLAIGLGSIAAFLLSLLNEKPGWQTIAFEDTSLISEGEFTFNYELGRTELSPNKEKRAVQACYADALGKAYKLFDSYRSYEGILNVYDLCQKPNEVLTVDSELYDAFAYLQSRKDRSIYLAPLQSAYRNIFLSNHDTEAASHDPHRNEDARAFATQIAAFASDPSAIDVELMQDHKVCLRVSDEYLAFLAEYEIRELVSFSYLTNAFVIDCVADALIQNGFSYGFLHSYDGYTRYLDASANRYAVTLYVRDGANVYPAALAERENISALVMFRNYPLNERNAENYYAYSDGTFATQYIDARDGLYKSACNDLVAYTVSQEKGCAALALSMSQAYICETLDEKMLLQASDEGIFSVWNDGFTLVYNDPNLALSELYDYDGVSFGAKKAD